MSRNQGDILGFSGEQTSCLGFLVCGVEALKDQWGQKMVLGMATETYWNRWCVCQVGEA